MSKFKLDFDGIEILSKRFEDMGGNLEGLANEALKQTHAHITPKIEQAMGGSKFNFSHTGITKSSLQVTPKIEWVGNVASVGVGFDIKHGGLPSIFLMYGTPTITPDRKLYSAVFSNKTRKEVQELQKETFLKAIIKG